MKRRNLNLNDYYDVLLDFEDVKELMEDVEADLVKFYSPTKTKLAGVRARRKLLGIQRRIRVIRSNLVKQRQDYDAEYW